MADTPAAPPDPDMGPPEAPDVNLDAAATRPRRRWLRALLRGSALLILVLAIGATLAWRWFDQNVLTDLPDDVHAIADHRPLTSVQLLDGDGEPLHQFHIERRVWVPIDELPPYLPQAFVAAEDRRFYEHPGVDFFGIARAVLANAQAGRTVQGGSTITQQLVKNVFVGSERSYERKMKEAVLAWRLERELSKRELLELYLNLVALGSGNYGVEAAARDYYGISARDLNLGQAALLAGLVPAPSRYSPWGAPELAARRRELVLRSMVRDGHVAPGEAVLFLSEPVVVPRVAAKRVPAASFVTQVRRDVRRLFGDRVPFEAGLVVHTTLDRRIQEVAEQAIRSATDAHFDRQGPRLVRGHLAAEQRVDFLARAPGLERDAETGDAVAPSRDQCFSALVAERRDLGALRAGELTLSLVDTDRRRTVSVDAGGDEDPRTGRLDALVRAGDVLPVCALDPTTVRLDDAPWAEGAAVAIENATGRVVALVGGRDVALEGFVRATQGRRQPGSSFKPYVYGAALLGERSQLDSVLDAPLSLNAGGGRTWAPKNYGGGYAGRLPMRSALARSLNTVAVRLILDVGPARVIALAKAMGVQSPLRRDPTLALGSSEVTAMDQAVGYSTIARLGVPSEPILIDRVADARGALLGSAGDTLVIAGQHYQLPGRPLPAALPPGVAAELADMMQEVVQSGTARRAARPGLQRAGKTGTTNGFVDAWFVGFTPRWTVAVWIGTDGTHSLGPSETGGKAALPAWIAIIEALGESPDDVFQLPSEAVVVPWQGKVALVNRDHAPLPSGSRGALGTEPLAPFSGR